MNIFMALIIFTFAPEILQATESIDFNKLFKNSKVSETKILETKVPGSVSSENAKQITEKANMPSPIVGKVVENTVEHMTKAPDNLTGTSIQPTQNGSQDLRCRSGDVCFKVLETEKNGDLQILCIKGGNGYRGNKYKICMSKGKWASNCNLSTMGNAYHFSSYIEAGNASCSDWVDN